MFNKICKRCSNEFTTKDRFISLCDDCAYKCNICGKHCQSSSIITEGYKICRYCDSMQKEIWECPECGFVGNGFDRVNKTCKGTIFKKLCIDCNEEFELDCQCSSKRKLKRCKDCQKRYHISCIEDSNLKIRGVRWPMQDPVSLNKNQSNQMKKFGGVLAFNSEKQRQTMLERYGAGSASNVEEVKRKSRETQFRNNNGVYAFNSEKQRQTMLERYGRLHKYFNPISNLNKKLADKISKKLNMEIEYEYRIGNVSYDFHIKGTNILIEYNPTISHNQDQPFLCQVSNCYKKKQEDKEYSCKHTCIPRTYHYDRVILALENNMICLHFYEWDSVDYIVETIRNILKYDEEITEKVITINLDTESHKRKILEEEGYEIVDYIENAKISNFRNRDFTVVCSGYEEWRKIDG